MTHFSAAELIEEALRREPDAAELVHAFYAAITRLPDAAQAAIAKGMLLRWNYLPATIMAASPAQVEAAMIEAAELIARGAGT